MYNFALRLNLTSHEKGRTARNQPRLPVLLPIAFPGLDWDAHPSIQLLAGDWAGRPAPCRGSFMIKQEYGLICFSRHHQHAGS
jgi:hypothetical protein